MIEAFTNPCILFQFDPNDAENVDKWLNGEDVHEIETNWVHMGTKLKFSKFGIT